MAAIPAAHGSARTRIAGCITRLRTKAEQDRQHDLAARQQAASIAGRKDRPEMPLDIRWYRRSSSFVFVSAAARLRHV
jgi:hypothetical protein